jgi:hypothetical protein
MIKIVVDSWFSLPRLGTEAFSSLMKAGVKYEKGMGFMFTQQTDLDYGARTLEMATGENVELSVRCFLCLQEACVDCTYQTVCDRKSISPMCLCAEHLTADDAYDAYVKAFEESEK